MRKRFSLLTMLALVIISLLAGAQLNRLFSGDSILPQVTKFNDVLSLTYKYYVDDVDTQKLTESAIGGLLNQLDPHSVYISASAMQRVTEEFQGSFEGIGIEYQVLNDTLLVVAPIAGGPSEALGIQSGDKIVRINDSSSVGITQDGVQKKLRGPKGTKVNVHHRPCRASRICWISRSHGTRYRSTPWMRPSWCSRVSGTSTSTGSAAKTHEEFLEAIAKLHACGHETADPGSPHECRRVSGAGLQDGRRTDAPGQEDRLHEGAAAGIRRRVRLVRRRAVPGSHAGHAGEQRLGLRERDRGGSGTGLGPRDSSSERRRSARGLCSGNST